MGNYCLMAGVSVWDDEKVLGIVIMVAQHYECT